MNTELDFGDLDDDEDTRLPTEAEIDKILRERNGIDRKKKKVRQRFQRVLQCNPQEHTCAWQGEEKDWLRKELERCQKERTNRVAIDCKNVITMPPGTFSIFHEKAEEGMEIYLLNPTEIVKRWLWFRAFAKDCKNECFRIHTKAQKEYANIAQSEIFRAPDEDDDE